MKYLLALAILIGLSGCETIQIREKVVTVVEYKYVIVGVPQQGLDVPPAPTVPDYETATDKEIAEFIIEQEGFAQRLINIIKNVPSYTSNAIDSLLKKGVKRENIIE